MMLAQAVQADRGLMIQVFSVQPLCPLCLRGESFQRYIHHRDTEDPEVAQRLPQSESGRIMIQGSKTG